MTGPATFEAQAEALKIRARPRAVTRLNRKVLIAGAGLGALGLFALASLALKPPKAAAPAEPPEVYAASAARQPEGLARLPASYDALPPKPAPSLGPPLSGDLGATFLAAERARGIEPPYTESFATDFRPNAEDEAARARRLSEAALAEEAARAPVFFRLDSRAAAPAGAAQDAASTAGADLLALAALRPDGPPLEPGAPDANLQALKRAFVGETGARGVYNAHDLEAPRSPYQVMAGTLISVSLVTGINSDLPGTIIAQVTAPVFDTITGDHLLIPQGARLLGRYQSDVAFGQDRALIVWDRIIFPDGASIRIEAPGADAQGYAGLSDRTDHHWGRAFAAAGLATLLGIGAELGEDDDSDIARAIRRGTGDTLNQAGQRVVDRNLGIQPTIRVRPGWPVRVIVTRDLILKPLEAGAAP